ETQGRSEPGQKKIREPSTSEGSRGRGREPSLSQARRQYPNWPPERPRGWFPRSRFVFPVEVRSEHQPNPSLRPPTSRVRRMPSRGRLVPWRTRVHFQIRKPEV